TLTISENVYRVSYKNDDVGVDFKGVPIGKCVDFNNTFGAYIPVLGEFNVARAGATSANPVDDALYTQVVNQDFSVDILSLSLDRKSLKAVTAKTKINIYI
ncbi:hypothetical protein, partial [Acinetobacter baumannii]|uniref:hypothetical protein n=1 Tax=Acinetobacter baumannii TaxID=470 RepID=UPI00339A1316